MAYRCFFIYSLVLSLSITLSLSADFVFISIDCGSSLPSRDGDEIDWVGDDKYVQSGESRSVKPSNSISHVADTLRVFTTRNKNCYHIDSVEKGRVLVRATFFYGNYDGKNSPPTFAIQFDGNVWDQVQTSSTKYYYYEVTYVMKKDSISVCVAQTEPDQFPFLTTLEVRRLESFMYGPIGNNFPLFHLRRIAFGSNTTIRYLDDPYDRIWAPEDEGLIKVKSDAPLRELAWLNDRPPPAVLKNAITTVTTNTSIELFMGFPSNQTTNVYINWFFSEVTKLEPNQTRSFRIFKDNESFSDPILPPYNNSTQQYIANFTVSSDTTFSLVATNDSTLPPLINAMEVFRVGESQLTDGTNKKDIEGLASLQNGLSVLREWSGDPCLPAPYTWDWIQCNNDHIPRVTALLLGGYGLSGLLPNFSSMDALQTIDLHNNSLRGPIPDFIGALPNLKSLNVAKNQFNGTVPVSLSTKESLTLIIDENPSLCRSNTSCQIPAAPANSSIKKEKKILELVFAALFPCIIYYYS